MSRVLAFFRIEKYDGHGLELLIARILFVAILFPWDFCGFKHGGFFFDFYYIEQRDPTGLAQWFDFTWLAEPEIAFSLVQKVCLITGIVYCLGVVPLPSLACLLVVIVSVGTLRNSQGNIHHGTQIVGLIALGQFLAYAVDLVNKGERGRLMKLFMPDIAAHRRAFFYSQQMIAAAYVIAGIAKLIRRDFDVVGWVMRLPNMAIFSDRNGWLRFYESNDREALEQAQRVTTFILENPWLTTAMIAPGLIAELFAFVALCNRRIAFLVGATILVMHWMIARVMQLNFPMNELVVWIFFINVPFMASWVILVLWRRWMGIDRAEA